jgi:SAM-dependent methyltransferase
MPHGLRSAVFLADRIYGRAITPVISHGRRRFCSACGWSGLRFVPFGYLPSRRSEAKCPSCGSLERHRLAHLIMRDWPMVRSTLHVAPEPQVASFLRNMSTEYISIDIRPAAAMRQEDLTKLSFRDRSFSLIFCSHVLEHVTEDRVAISEMRRVLEPSGVLVVLVPLRGKVTDEEPITDPDERFRRFGMWDHVRYYGLDIIDRLQSEFRVEHRTATEWAPADRTRLGLDDETAFVCTAA